MDGKKGTTVEIIARIGYAAKGIVYLLVGVFSASAAWRAGHAKGSKDSVRALLDEPFGQILVGAIAAGLACYAAWRLIRAILNPENEGDGSDGKGALKRAVSLISGLLHLGLAFALASMLFGDSSGSGSGSGNGNEEKVSTLMGLPGGRWIVGGVGFCLAGLGVYRLYKAWTVDLDDRIDMSSLSAKARRAVIVLGRAGMAARGLVFMIVGAFFVISAWEANPDKAQGLAESLSWLQNQPFGPWLMGGVALGLACYGAYMLAKSRFREIA